MVEGCTIQDAITVINLQYLKEKTAFIYRADGPHLSRGASRTAGVLGPVVGVMGTLQALEAIKLLSGIETPSGELRLFDGKTSQWRSLALHRASGCPVCGGQHADSVQ